MRGWLLRWTVRMLTAVVAAAGLSACMDEKPSQPSFYVSMAGPGTQLDAKTAASMISGYRANNGLGAVELDPQLMEMAEAQAREMAAQDRLERRPNAILGVRLRRAGYDSKTAAENVSAGYHTLAEAFSGWRDSPPHRATMLLPGATHMGIAAAYAPSSKYKVFWTLILAAPGSRRG